ncbi:uncharacterized protein LOC117910354 [Vitis riparia]|uniref:uncharacterized protein LOC117910354 n=1 Tax=Vitis riparia TaxID=96939 RepID=UPI00155AFE12|nr:uncharacterized protein LOC117910354 [Vitis riparia]XP_034680322.1 uncharacterized protein LOC117910354 [Vitis riparia]
MASSSSLRLRNDNSANSPKNSNMDIAEEVTVMVIDDSPNNPNCSSINMAQDTDENVSAVLSSSLPRTSSSEFGQLELYKAVLHKYWRIIHDYSPPGSEQMIPEFFT